MVTCLAIAIRHAIATCCRRSIHCHMVGMSYPNTHQIRRTANAALEASTPSCATMSVVVAQAARLIHARHQALSHQGSTTIHAP